MKAEALSRKPGHVGAVAFSRSGDPATGDFSDAGSRERRPLLGANGDYNDMDGPYPPQC
jgi:hypothetical protein